MPRRHPARLPTIWLMTDARMGDALWDALEQMPRGGGVVFRHYDVPDRGTLFARVRQVARRRRLLLLSAGGALPGSDGVHNGRGHGLMSRSVHSRRELVAAIRARADLVFVSPVFATRSHSGARVLRQIGLARLARDAPMPVIALGGMTARRFATLGPAKIYGWAGIDAWTAPGGQKRNAVPT